MTPTEMIPHLQDYYAEQVIDGLGRRDRAKFVRDVNVQFVQALEATNGLMFELCISLKPIYSIDLQPLVNYLDQYCTTDEEAGGQVVLDGYKFLLGDGDDSQAVRLEDGTFKIWLRGWRE